MHYNIEEFKTTIQSLPLHDRVGMLEALRDSVLDDQNIESIAEQVDLDTMRKRYQGYLDGHITARSWDEVKADIRSSL